MNASRRCALPDSGHSGARALEWVEHVSVFETAIGFARDIIPAAPKPPRGWSIRLVDPRFSLTPRKVAWKRGNFIRTYVFQRTKRVLGMVFGQISWS